LDGAHGTLSASEEHAGGNVLLISGTDVSSTEAGGDFITNESSILSLRKALAWEFSKRYPL
jgi:hypothetical protein